MTTENAPKTSYEAVLADLRAKRAEIDATIRTLEMMSGLKSSDTGVGKSFLGEEITDASAESEAGLFLGMSIVDATKKLLALRKRAMGNPEIARELKAGGLVLNSADPVNTIGSVLTRRFNQIGDVVKISRGTWGLKEWYPNRTFKSSGKQPIASDVPNRAVDEDEANGTMEPNPDVEGLGSLQHLIGASLKKDGSEYDL